MGRLKPAWYYQKKATEATARANYYQNRPPSTTTTVKTRGAATTLYYRSMLNRLGTDPIIYSVQVDDGTLGKITAAEAGLKNTLASGEVALRLRGSGVKPTRLHWYRGDATPSAQTTSWNTRWIKYYALDGDQSHFSIPFSKATGTIAPSDLQDSFDALFGASGTKKALLGTSNGRAYLQFERAAVSAMS